MRAYRVTVTIETFKNEGDLKLQEAEPVRELINHAASTDYDKAFKTMDKALSKLGLDPLYGESWESW